MNTIDKRTYLGILLISSAVLAYEILLTRIFSVTMGYHFAFMSISIALFGITVGGIIVYLFPTYFSKATLPTSLTISSLLFSISLLTSFLFHLSRPFIFDKTLVGLFSAIFNYFIISIPFIFSGICLCLAFTKLYKFIGKLYAVNLIGSAFGSLIFLFIINITDGLTSVFIVSIIGFSSSIFFSLLTKRKILIRAIMFINILLFFFVITNTVFLYKQSSPLRILWVRGKPEEKPLFEKWNSFSRIQVIGNPHQEKNPSSWNLSQSFQAEKKIRQLTMMIDADASTELIGFNGDFNTVDYLKYDMTNLVHHLRPNSKVLIIGSGAQVDILSALLFKQKEIIGVEINNNIIETTNNKFGDFTGHLDRFTQVRIVNDEARSYIARSQDQFDIIQAAFIDTWAATTAGAYVLTENSLYTIEAWKQYIEHLSPRGILTFSRWYFIDLPGEMYRLTSLASVALKELGIKNPQEHIVIVGNVFQKNGDYSPDGVGAIFVSKKPFSRQDLKMIDKLVEDMNFEIIYSPTETESSIFTNIALGKNLHLIQQNLPINILPPTDDKPFFFNMVKFRNIFKMELLYNQEIFSKITSINTKSILILVLLFITVTLLSIPCIFLPLLLRGGYRSLKGSLPLVLYFISIGVGYMMIEISQMQRLAVFLGHPIYSLSIVLFVLLISSGLGSYSTEKYFLNTTKRLAVLILVLLVIGIYSSQIIYSSQHFNTILRILISIGILFPLGFFMGMPFPIGMRLASNRSKSLMPWLWGINGAASVWASVFSLTVAITLGISFSYWIGFLCYTGAIISHRLIAKTS